MAKVEKPEAVADLEGIVQATDSVMIARGDLGVEVPMEQVPMIQSGPLSSASAKANRSSWPPK